MEYQFKIQIKGISEPPVWRKIIVPANFSFQRLHNVIQTAFGWEDYHVFDFRDKESQGSIRIGIITEFDFDVELQDASKVKLSDIFTGDTRNFFYVYDFGDDWVHEITLEAVSDDKREEAFCLSGEGKCPPEDCGGTYRFEYMKHILRTMPDCEMAVRYRNWLGLNKNEIWDATAFDIDKINADLKQV